MLDRAGALCKPAVHRLAIPNRSAATPIVRTWQLAEHDLTIKLGRGVTPKVCGSNRRAQHRRPGAGRRIDGWLCARHSYVTDTEDAPLPFQRRAINRACEPARSNSPAASSGGVTVIQLWIAANLVVRGSIIFLRRSLLSANCAQMTQSI